MNSSVAILAQARHSYPSVSLHHIRVMAAMKRAAAMKKAGAMQTAAMKGKGEQMVTSFCLHRWRGDEKMWPKSAGTFWPHLLVPTPPVEAKRRDHLLAFTLHGRRLHGARLLHRRGPLHRRHDADVVQRDGRVRVSSLSQNGYG